MKRRVLLLLLALLPGLAAAQDKTATDFPPNATTPSAKELSAFLSGKSFRSRYADGTPVRSKFGADGDLTASSPGIVDAGRWNAEDGKLCGSFPGSGNFCNDARFDAGVLYLRRTNGEVVRYDSD